MYPLRALALAAAAALVCAAGPAAADRGHKPRGKHPYPRAKKVTSPWLVPLVSEVRHIGAFRARGKTKVTDTTIGYLTHLHVGDPVRPSDIPKIEEALLSSELFEKIKVTLEDGPEGVVVVATVKDKLSWIAAPTLYVVPSNLAFGIGFVQNDLAGRDQKILMYGQLGTQDSFFVGAFLDPAVHGSKLYYRADVYLERRNLDEYLNPADDQTSQAVARTTTETFLDAGFLVGWNFRWWLGADLRLRSAYVYFRDAKDGAGNALPIPEKDGWDTTIHAQLTADHRVHRFGVATGAYGQAHIERSLPVVDDYQYWYYFGRAYYSWRLFGEHELEVRGIASGGYHMPMQEEVSLGGVSDLRGYATDQFRGDLNLLARAEYSIPLFKYRIFAFRALGFFDTGYAGFYNTRTDRLYLPTQVDQNFQRSDAGVGFRVYLKNVVLPLLGLDVGYGIEGKSPEVYFEVGLTDF